MSVLALRSLLLREQILNMFKRLELNRVARWVKEEHSGLLARFAFEADMRFDDEFGFGGGEARGEVVPLLHREHDAEVAAGDVVAVDLGGFGHRAFFRREVSDDLMTVEIKVHPVWAGAALFAAEEIQIELACCGEVVRWEG